MSRKREYRVEGDATLKMTGLTRRRLRSMTEGLQRLIAERRRLQRDRLRPEPFPTHREQKSHKHPPPSYYCFNPFVSHLSCSLTLQHSSSPLLLLFLHSLYSPDLSVPFSHAFPSWHFACTESCLWDITIDMILCPLFTSYLLFSGAGIGLMLNIRWPKV